MRALLLLAILLGATACGARDEVGDAATWTARGEEAFAAGDRLAQDEASLPEAVLQWRRAGSAFVKAFRLEDPLAERAEVRAWLAFRVGRSWSKAARFGTDEARRGQHADRALFWFAHARRLYPLLRQAYFERARLFDSDIEDVRDPVRALEQYRAYIHACEQGGTVEVGEAEAERLALAKRRVAEAEAPR